MKFVGTTTIFTAQKTVYVSATVRELYSQKENVNFNFQLPAFFFFFVAKAI